MSVVFDPNVSVDLVQNTHNLRVYINSNHRFYPPYNRCYNTSPFTYKVAKSLKIEMSNLCLSFHLVGNVLIGIESPVKEIKLCHNIVDYIFTS
jgi:hypothetical protein